MTDFTAGLITFNEHSPWYCVCVSVGGGGVGGGGMEGRGGSVVVLLR